MKLVVWFNCASRSCSTRGSTDCFASSVKPRATTARPDGLATSARRGACRTRAVEQEAIMAVEEGGTRPSVFNRVIVVARETGSKMVQAVMSLGL